MIIVQAARAAWARVRWARRWPVYCWRVFWWHFRIQLADRRPAPRSLRARARELALRFCDWRRRAAALRVRRDVGRGRGWKARCARHARRWDFWWSAGRRLEPRSSGALEDLARVSIVSTAAGARLSVETSRRS